MCSSRWQSDHQCLPLDGFIQVYICRACALHCASAVASGLTTIKIGWESTCASWRSLSWFKVLMSHSSLPHKLLPRLPLGWHLYNWVMSWLRGVTWLTQRTAWSPSCNHQDRQMLPQKHLWLHASICFAKQHHPQANASLQKSSLQVGKSEALLWPPTSTKPTARPLKWNAPKHFNHTEVD